MSNVIIGIEEVWTTEGKVWECGDGAVFTNLAEAVDHAKALYKGLQ